MQLKYDRKIQNRIITLTLESVNFTEEEIKMIDDLGDPIINMDKTYQETFKVLIVNKKLKTGFKNVMIKFDGTLDMAKAETALTEFIEDLKVIISSELEKIRDIYNSVTIRDESGFIDIV